MFGHGLPFAGLTLLTLLDQKDRFDALDFSYHIMRVHTEDQPDDSVPGLSLKRFIGEINHLKEINDSMSVVLDRYLMRSSKSKNVDVYIAPPGADKLPKGAPPAAPTSAPAKPRPGSTMV